MMVHCIYNKQIGTYKITVLVKGPKKSNYCATFNFTAPDRRPRYCCQIPPGKSFFSSILKHGRGKCSLDHFVSGFLKTQICRQQHKTAPLWQILSPIKCNQNRHCAMIGCNQTKKSISGFHNPHLIGITA